MKEMRKGDMADAAAHPIIQGPLSLSVDLSIVNWAHCHPSLPLRGGLSSGQEEWGPQRGRVLQATDHLVGYGDSKCSHREEMRGN